MSVPVVFGRLKLPPRDPLDNLVHLTPDERADSRPCVCEDCIRQCPERRILKIQQLADARKALHCVEKL
jgi:hypothetical protein